MVNVRARQDTGQLFLDFRYRGVRCREQTALADTPENRKRVEALAKRIQKEMQSGSFDYAAHFPSSPRADKFARPADASAAPALQEAVSVALAPTRDTPTFAEFADLWYLEMSPQWRALHRQGVREVLDKNLLPMFGARLVHTITKADVLAFRADIAKQHNLEIFTVATHLQGQALGDEPTAKTLQFTGGEAVAAYKAWRDKGNAPPRTDPYFVPPDCAKLIHQQAEADLKACVRLAGHLSKLFDRKVALPGFVGSPAGCWSHWFLFPPLPAEIGGHKIPDVRQVSLELLVERFAPVLDLCKQYGVTFDLDDAALRPRPFRAYRFWVVNRFLRDVLTPEMRGLSPNRRAARIPDRGCAAGSSDCRPTSATPSAPRRRAATRPSLPYCRSGRPCRPRTGSVRRRPSLWRSRRP